jgi:hypothetical protein
MHVLLVLTTITTAEYVRTYVVNSGGISIRLSLYTKSINPTRLNLLFVVSVPAEEHTYIYHEPFMAARHESVPKQYCSL